MTRPAPTASDESDQQTLDAFRRRRLCGAPLSSLAWYGSIPTLYFTTDRDGLSLSPLLGESLTVTLREDRICTSCGVESDRSPCAECYGTPPHAQCIYSPGNACTYQECPFPDYRETTCSHDFEVYLAAKDQIKVGMTRAGRREKRLRGQGATHGLIIARAKNRKLAGIIETCCEDVVTDRAPSGWFEPLDNPREALIEIARQCEGRFPDRLRPCSTTADSDTEELRDRVFALKYPGCRCLDDAEFASLPALQVGETRTGILSAVRGKTLVTDTFAFETKGCAGHTVAISIDRSGEEF